MNGIVLIMLALPTQITGAVGSSYTVTADDISYKIFARVEYTESDGTTMDSADSAQTIAVATANAAPTITVSGTVAIDQGNYIGSQEQEITGFTIDVTDDNPADLTYTLIGTDGNGTGENLFRIDATGIYAIGDIAHADGASYEFQCSSERWRKSRSHLNWHHHYHNQQQ